MHGITRSAITKAQGGRYSSGFWSGFASSGFSPGTTMGGDGSGGFALRTSISGVIGGTVSEISGGKFSNGAVTGAFVHMFNAEFGKYARSTNDVKALNVAFGSYASNPVGEKSINSHSNITWGEVAVGAIAITNGLVLRAAIYLKNIFYLRPLETIAVSNFINDAVNPSLPASSVKSRIYYMYDKITEKD